MVRGGFSRQDPEDKKWATELREDSSEQGKAAAKVLRQVITGDVLKTEARENRAVETFLK